MNTYKGRHIFWIVIGGMFFLFSSCNNYSVSEKQEESFLKYYAVDIEDNTGTVVIQTSDGGFAILSNYENIDGQKDMLLIITDEFGRQKGSPVTIGTARLDDHGYSMIRVDNGYLISGSSAVADSIKGYLANISNDGTTLWQRNYSGYQEMEFRDAALAQDGNLIMTGYIKNDPGDEETILFKTSAEGDSMWIRIYRWPGHDDVGEAIIEYQQRYHILTTSTDVSNTRQSWIRMLNTDTDGKGITSYRIEKEYLSGKDIAKNAAGNLYILGNTQDPESISRIFLAELEVEWDGTFTTLKDSASIPDLESLYGESFVTVGEDALAVGGWQVKQNDNDILFLLVGNEYQVQIRKTYGAKGFQASQNIISTNFDQGFALTGSVDLAGGRTSMLLKIDSEGELR